MGRVLIIEFSETDTKIFDEVTEVLKKYPAFEYLRLKDETVLSFPGLEIRPKRRTVYCDCQKVHLTTKEFDILYLLVTNKGQVLTYEQIYQRVWGEFPSGEVSGTIGYHVRNLRKKLRNTPSFAVQCTREVGYCFEIES